MKKKIVTIVIVIATIALAGVAVFTAIRLYQLREESVAPTAPTSEPAAAQTVSSCTQLAFTLTVESPSPSPSGSESPSPTSSPTTGPTSSPTDSPTSSPSSTSSPTTTTEPSLPEAGVSYPTIIGVGAGILVILGSLLLVF